MRKNWIPNSGECVVIDTNIVSYAKRRAYGRSCTALLNQLTQQGIKRVLPQIVEYELLRHTRSTKEYTATQKWLSTEFIKWPMSEGILRSATMLHALLYWHDISQRFAERKDFLEDLLVAATAGRHQMEQKCKTYILSGDQGYSLPYLIPVARYELLPSKDAGRKQYLHFYEIDVDLINKDWKQYWSKL